MRTPHLYRSHFPRGRHPDAPHHHHHQPAFRTLRRVEGGIDLFAIALVVLFALAMIYALLSPEGTPAYFNR